MEEKTIIKSENYNIKGIRLAIFLIGLIPSLIIFLPLILADIEYYGRVVFSCVLERLFGMLIVWLPFFIIGELYYLWMSKIELIVSDKRVYGRAAFGKQVDLPLDSISAVGTWTLFKGISVASSAGSIKFGMIKNRDAIHSAISKLLMERQNKSAGTTIRQEIPQSNADELKKFKDLLDAGVITQEEFDAKKKQLLGL